MSTTAIPAAGGCLCGSIRYTVTEAPAMSAVCHCRNCQQQSGSAYSVMIAVPLSALHFDAGQPRCYRDTGTSGQPVDRYFCGDCGSPLYSDVAVLPGMAFVKAGTLDDPAWVEPTQALWCDSALPSARLADDITRLPGNPPV
ncbi:MAG: GFA family protein [Salinisphaeraceae bacterium]